MNKRLPRFAGCLAVALLALAFLIPQAQAQSYPSRPIRIIVPSAAGTPPDIVTRVIANELAQSEGWQTVVENKFGAMQTIGIAEVLKQPADGHTIITVAQSSTVAPALLPNISFRLDTDLTPIIKIMRPIMCLSCTRPLRQTPCPNLSPC